MAIVRAGALLALAAGCGDDDDPKPAGDGGLDGGGMDGGGLDGGDGGGGGGDAGTDASSDGGASDAGAALAAALVTTGVRADDERAALVIPAFCTSAVRCNLNDAGVTQVVCEAAYAELWQDNKNDGDSVACLDAQLDFVSCVATTQCAQLLGCFPFRQTQEALCARDGG